MLKVAKNRLLVVGGTGFIGFHLILCAKKRGWKVSSISLNKPKKNRHIFGVNYLKIDITNLKELKKKLKGNFDYIVNLGGYVNHAFSYKKKQSIIKVHYMGLINLTKEELCLISIALNAYQMETDNYHLEEMMMNNLL